MIDLRHDVAHVNGETERHIILRAASFSLCGAIARGPRGYLSYVGAWDDGEAPTCEKCLAMWRRLKAKSEKEGLR